jgi:hypothetical protein
MSVLSLTQPCGDGDHTVSSINGSLASGVPLLLLACSHPLPSPFFSCSKLTNICVSQAGENDRVQLFGEIGVYSSLYGENLIPHGLIFFHLVHSHPQ